MFSLFLGEKGLVLNLVFLIGTTLILFFYKKKMNCITGDMLGAMNEVLEAVLFLGAGAVLGL
jgi:adenosylcobinamide-GDP ribazoletransferase